MDVPQHGDADQRGRHRQGLWPDVLRRVHVPEHLHRQGRAGHDRLCLQLPRLHPGGGHHPDRPIVVQKSGFLASEAGVELSVFFQKKGMAGFFSGEGFILQKLSGHGTAFLEIDGSAVEYDLQPGQQIIIDTGNLAMLDATCTVDVRSVKGVKNVLFGGEGLFNTVVTGPGRVVLQTMPISNFAGAIAAILPSK